MQLTAEIAVVPPDELLEALWSQPGRQLLPRD